MYLNLKCELLKKGITYKQIAKLLGLGEKTIYNKINGNSEFTFSEVKKIKQTLFPDLTLEYLFEN